jgi:uncharacterized protein DUF3606
MTDDLNIRQPQDRTKINVHEAWELSYRTKNFGVSADALKRAVAQVGPSVEAVKRQLGK